MNKKNRDMKTVNIFAYIITGVCLISCNNQDKFVSSIEPTIDLSSQKDRRTIVAAGTEEIYQGHPTTALLDDGTVLCVWTLNHGGPCGPMAKSENGGKSWEMIETPADWTTMENCPAIYRLTDPSGKERLFVYGSEPETGYTFSEDNGKTWSPVKSMGIESVMPFCSIVRLKDGSYLGMSNRRPSGKTKPDNEVYQAISKDGGFTWEDIRTVVPMSENDIPCEPFVFRSPDGNQLCCLIRDNKRDGHSLVMFSNDEAKTWTEPVETIWGLTGDRHVGKYAPDGRLVFVFRDMAPLSPTRGHFVAWVGDYDDIVNCTPGDYRVKLLHSYKGADCGYPGLELLPDGTFLATTYIKLHNTEEKNSVVSVRFRLSEIEEIIK